MFSHGLGSSRNSYSTLLTELASRGYMIFAPELFNDIGVIISKEISLEKSTPIIARRVLQIESILYHLKDEGFLKNIYEVPVHVDLSKAVGMEHSFGACTQHVLGNRDIKLNDITLYEG